MRPQLTRDDSLDLSGVWSFAFDDADRGLCERWFERPEAFDREITVPYPYESTCSGIGDRARHPVVWYCREVVLPAPQPGQRMLLHFGAVDYSARVWVNGQHVGSHEGGHTSFGLDITGALDGTGAQRLVVRVEDRSDDPTQPRGKQDWHSNPHGIWYERTTGIWQPVWCETVPQTFVAELDWSSDLVRGRVGCAVRLRGPVGPGWRLGIRLRLGDDVLADQTTLIVAADPRVELDLAAARHGQDLGPLLWSPEHPHLIEAEVALIDADGNDIDRVGSYLGFRDVGYADGRFLLNGHPYFLRMALHQGYWPGSHLSAPDADALRAEVQLAKDLGFNGVRVHQKIEDPRFLAWCDRIGMLVWEEMPSAYEFAPRAIERVTAEWTEAIRRDRSHPCIVTWVPLNESWGVPRIADDPAQRHYASALYHLTRALDPTRPAISNDGWEHTESDIWGVHDYAAHGAPLRERFGDPAVLARVLRERRPGRRRVLLGDPVDRGQPVVLSEFGGLSFAPAEGQKWFGYATVQSADELEARLADLVGAVLDSPELAGFCWTQLTDTAQERNGLVTEDRVPKLPVERIREILNRPAAAIPPEQIDASRRVAGSLSAGGPRD